MRAFLIAFFVTLAGIATWNVRADVNDVLRSAPLEPWPAGQALSIKHSQAYRPLKRTLALSAERPDILVLGNSHLFGARQDALGGQKLLNLSVPAGELEDITEFWAVMKEQGKIPRAVLMPLEPAFINGDCERFFQSFHRPSAARFIAHSNLSLADKAYWLAWLAKHSFRGFCDAVFGWSSLAPRWGQPGFKFLPLAEAAELPRTQAFNHQGTEVKKGFLEGYHDQALFLAREDEIMADRSAGLEPWGPSPRRKRLWQALMADMRAQGCEVWVLATPLHPYAQKGMTAYAGAYAETRAWLLEKQREGLIQKLHLQPDGADWGCKGSDFYDGTHPASPCLDRILQQWAAVPAKLQPLR